MMKFKNHVFFMLGLASVFSMGKTNCAFAHFWDCSANVPSPGYFCKLWTNQKCRPGCYCKGNTKNNVRAYAVDNMCSGAASVTSEELTILHQAGVYLCREIKNADGTYTYGTYSDAGADGPEDCYGASESTGDKDCTQFPPAGKYCRKRGTHSKCPAGCYCTGSSKRSWDDSGLSSSNKLSNMCAHPENVNSTIENDLKERHIYFCPAEFPHSAETAKNINDCYTTLNGSTFFYTTKTCPAGTYLPKVVASNVGDCKPCEVDNYCEGFTNRVVSLNEDIGMNECPGSSTTNGETGATKCYVSCHAGKYLPANSDSSSQCMNCLDNYYCPGGNDFIANFGNAQGLSSCPNGQHPSADHSSCEPDEDNDTGDTGGNNGSNSGGGNNGNNNGGGSGNGGSGTSEELGDIIVDAGYYLPSGKTKHSEQRLCYGVSNFCPGGVFSTEDFDQGIYECPGNGRAANDKKSCNVSLGKEDLRSGVSRASECWLLTDRDDFMECVFGGELYNVSNSISNAGNDNTGTATSPNHTQYEREDNDFIEVNPRSMRVDNGGTSGLTDTAKDKLDYVSKEPVAQKKITNNTTQPLGITTAAKVEGASASFNAARSVRKR